jgi:hypothetical protein
MPTHRSAQRLTGNTPFGSVTYGTHRLKAGMAGVRHRGVDMPLPGRCCDAGMGSGTAGWRTPSAVATDRACCGTDTTVTG